MKGKFIPWLYIRRFPRIFLGILLTLYSIENFGQANPAVLNPAIFSAGRLIGRVQNSVDRKSCPLIVVSVLQLADSGLVQFTRTKPDGSFSFQGIPKGRYRIIVSNPYYADYSALVVVGADSVTDLGLLIMVPKADLLSSVIVIPNTPSVYIRGDTSEFITSNVKLKGNATVEDLLNRLPGIQIDQNGGITVNGQKVERLLVDGEDLFGADPTIVTRNFNADMIAKVQVLDKKSSHAEFTGVDDGRRVKTVNLTLKEDSKKGYFVKTEGGADPQGYYNSNGLLGSFKDSRQLTALAMTANDGTTGYSSGSTDNGAALSIGGGGGDASAGPGIPLVAGAGLHYVNKWSGNQDHVTGNYSYGHLLTRPYSTSLTEQILPDSVYTQTQNSNSVNSNNQYNFSTDYDFIPDSVSAFRFSLGGTGLKGQNQFGSTGSSYFNDTLVNSDKRIIHSLVHNQDFNGNVMYRIHSREKKERNFAIVMGLARQDNTTSGYLYDINNFYHPNGKLLSADTTDQRKFFANYGLSFNGSVNFTQPLWKGGILAVSYGLSFNRSQSLQSTYNRGGGKYEDFVDSLSNHYRNDVLTQQTTINLQSTNRPLTYTIGGDILRYSYRELDLIKESQLRYHFFDIAPRANMRYNINKVRSISFDYSGTTQQPSILQLQPIQNNNDPLHITLGNPDLRPGFSHHLAAVFNSIKPVNVTVGINFGFTSDDISTKTYTDSLGRQISQAVNVTGSENGGVFFGINPKPGGIDLGFISNLFFIRNVNFVGNLLSNNDNYSTGVGLSLGKFVPEKYGIRLNSSVNYTYSRSSISSSIVTRYFTQSHNAELSYFLFPGLELNTNCYYTWRQKTSLFDKNNSTILWNAYISANFLSSELSVRWRINDLLSQNMGISRSITANQVSETTTNMIGRYWMISAIYRFKKGGKRNG